MISDLIASLSPSERKSLTWGDRGNGQYWQAKCLGISTVDNGGPYKTDAGAIAAVLEMVRAK